MDVVVEVDSREKTPRLKPLPIPHTLRILSPSRLPTDLATTAVSITVERTHLPTGDYCLKGYRHVCLIERKKSLSELARNCLTLDGRRKFTAECSRLRSTCARPVLLIEGSVAQLLHRWTGDYDPWLAIDAYQRICFEYAVEMIHATCINAHLGTYIIHLLVNAALTAGAPKLEPLGTR